MAGAVNGVIPSAKFGNRAQGDCDGRQIAFSLVCTFFNIAHRENVLNTAKKEDQGKKGVMKRKVSKYDKLNMEIVSHRNDS